jgi:hypothetical protein
MILSILIFSSSAFCEQKNEMDMYEYDSLFLEISDKRLGVSNVAIEKVKNPFVMTKTVLTENGETVEASKAEITYKLFAIFGNKAKINGKWYRLGDKIDYYKLSKITSKSVLMIGTNNKKELFIRNNDENNVKFSSK